MIAIFNIFLSGVASALSAVLSLLPTSPFLFMESLDLTWLNYANYIMPINAAVAHLQAFCLAVMVWYGLRVLLRWLKAVSS